MAQMLNSLRKGRGLPKFAAVTLAWMVLVILEGAVVRATGSGAGCGNHWPLCNGEVIPQHPRLATIIEFAHRSLTGICSGLTFALIAWTFWAQPKGAWVRKAVSWVGVLLITEALLGAVLVKGGYVEHNTSTARVAMQCIHFTNTMLLLGALSLAWWWQRPRASSGPAAAGTRTLSIVAMLCTILTGATGSVAALADTLFPSVNLRLAIASDFASGSPALVRMRWIHPAASVLALAAIVLLAAKLDRKPRRCLLLLLASQFVLGIADVLLLAPVSLQVLHLLSADLLWIALVALTADTVFVRQPEQARYASLPHPVAEFVGHQS